DLDGPAPRGGPAGEEVVVLEEDQPRAAVADELLHLVDDAQGIAAPPALRPVRLVEGDDRAEGALPRAAAGAQHRRCRQLLAAVVDVAPVGLRELVDRPAAGARLVDRHAAALGPGDALDLPPRAVVEPRPELGQGLLAT